MTFGSGFTKYYTQIIDGDVLVLSTFFPKAPWRAELAMARNPVIYGLADEIYVAESSDKGGTWSGVVDGLRKGRKIFVRQPEPAENNANQILIEKGAIPVDVNGQRFSKTYEISDIEQMTMVEEPNESELPEEKIRSVFNGKPLNINELITKLDIDWTAKKLISYLNKLDFIEIVKYKNINLYRLKGKGIHNKHHFFLKKNIVLLFKYKAFINIR